MSKDTSPSTITGGGSISSEAFHVQTDGTPLRFLNTDTVACPSCGVINMLGSNYCCVCGGQIQQPDDKRKCPRCKVYNPDGWDFCNNCGVRREAVAGYPTRQQMREMDIPPSRRNFEGGHIKAHIPWIEIRRQIIGILIFSAICAAFFYGIYLMAENIGVIDMSAPMSPLPDFTLK